MQITQSASGSAHVMLQTRTGRLAPDFLTLSGYLGASARFDDAVARFALAYANQECAIISLSANSLAAYCIPLMTLAFPGESDRCRQDRGESGVRTTRLRLTEAKQG
jgi:hypothetical protein